MNANVPGLRDGVPFRVAVEFHSDWICATGTARHGAVDRQVQRDVHRFPLLGGKTLMAVLRDAAETVARGLDGSDDPAVWAQWVDALFGGQPAQQKAGAVSSAPPRPAALEARPLHLPASVRAAVLGLPGQERELVTAALVIRRPGVRIDPATGVAADDMLRIEERARAGLTVTADWTVHFGATGAPVPWQAELLLLAAARLVTEIGGKRRRGAGSCTVRVDVPGSTPEDRLGTLLNQCDQPGAPPKAEPQTSAPRLGEARDGEVLRLRHELRITALTPLIMIREVRGNMVLTDPFVRGTMLVPLVHRALGAQAGELIGAGRVVVTDATPELDGRRATPVPLALQEDKDTRTGPLLNRIHPEAPEMLRHRPVGGYHVVTGDRLLVGGPELVERAHAVIDDEKQRPTEDSGGLYVNQAMAAGTVLRAQVWLPVGVELDAAELTGERSLGRSRKDDYGQVRVEVVDPAPPDDGRPADVQDGDELLVWLRSDVVLRGERGQAEPTTGRLAQVLGTALGVTLKNAPDDDRPAGLIDTQRIESWQTRWGLPRPSLLALRAGSVLRYTVHGTVDPALRTRVEANGIGERRAEGFGRVALQPAVLKPVEWQHDTWHQATPQLAAAALGDAERRMLDDLRGHAWRQELRRRAMTRAQDAKARAALLPPGRVSAAQLGALRVLADRMLADGDTTAAEQWLRSPRREGWKKVRRLLSASDTDALWTWLETSPPADMARRLRLDALCWVLTETARAQVQAMQDGGQTESDEGGPA